MSPSTFIGKQETTHEVWLCDQYGRRLTIVDNLIDFEIVKVVNERTGGRFRWKEGTLYPCLHRLEAMGMVKSVWREAPNGKKRKRKKIATHKRKKRLRKNRHKKK